MASQDATGPSMLDLIFSDPGLPRPGPTQSYWQSVPHVLAQQQSSSLPAETDVAIVGSGITGLGVAISLLKYDPQIRVTVLEARELCSGATGRNGGQLAINAAESYAENRERVGPEMATKIVRFTIRTLDRVREIINEFEIPDTEVCNVRKVRAFMDKTVFEKAQKSLALLEADEPSLKGFYEVIDGKHCQEEHGVYGAVGGLLHPAGTVWPYRLVTGAWSNLLELYGNRLTIETNTPVTKVDYATSSETERPYTVHTPRGTLRVKHVSYNTNGHTSHLLEELRGILFPLRGTMTAQDVSELVPNKGAEVSWAIHYTPEADPETGAFADGLCYMAQSAKTGLFYFGGEKCLPQHMITGDDTFVAPISQEFLEETLLRFFGQHDKSKQHVQSIWTGIMCFSSDGLPLCGRLPESITHRNGNGEWIAGVYNGYGMPYALLMGEALGKLILGKETDAWFPEAFLLTDSRLQTTLSKESARELAASIEAGAA